jgi:chemotaxis family two-component system response regulator Rcp1
MSPSAAKHGLVNVLLVEDNPVDVLVIKEAVATSPFKVQLSVAHDGQEAVEFLHSNCHSGNGTRPCPDLVLLDLNLPKMNGHQVLAEIRRDPNTSHIPVIILTSSADPEDIRQTYSLRGNCFVTKPVDLATFLKVVSSIQEFWSKVATLPEAN